MTLEEAHARLQELQQHEGVDELLLTTLLNSFPLTTKRHLAALTMEYMGRVKDGPEFERLLIEAVQLFEDDRLTLSHITDIALLGERVREQIAVAREAYSQAFD